MLTRCRVNRYSSSSLNQATASSNLPQRPNFAQQPPAPQMNNISSIPTRISPVIPAQQARGPQSPSFPAQQARLPPSSSAVDMTTLSGRENLSIGAAALSRRQSSSVVPSTSAQGPTSRWPAEGIAHAGMIAGEPRIFPGVVSKSARRDSIRQGSMSERDREGSASQRAKIPLSSVGTRDEQQEQIGKSEELQ